ncbi:hypothetical protein [Comamonas thiooxydans]|uniref:hypothetical protein n=1 Tax=Comamonas thiooxydans TaxID=363952 RepID=UPI0013DA673A|nr:hypothetical protein [Comamonas thiooxydans]
MNLVQTIAGAVSLTILISSALALKYCCQLKAFTKGQQIKLIETAAFFAALGGGVYALAATVKGPSYSDALSVAEFCSISLTALFFGYALELRNIKKNGAAACFVMIVGGLALKIFSLPDFASALEITQFGWMLSLFGNLFIGIATGMLSSFAKGISPDCGESQPST